MLLIYAITGFLAVLSLVLSNANQLYTFMGIVVIGGLLLYLMTRRTQESFDADSYPDDPAGGMLAAGHGIRRDQARPIAPEPPVAPTTPRPATPEQATRPGPAPHDAR